MKDVFATNILGIIDGLIYGTKSDSYPEGVPGLGETTEKAMAMTNATECYGGTSGRGNPNIKSKIRGAAHLGFVRIEKRGRKELVSLTQKGLDFYRQNDGKVLFGH